jgi:hypothetical protein
MEALPRALEIIFEMQRKRNNEKLTRRKKAFQLTKHVSFHCEPFLLSNFITFLFLIHLKQFKIFHNFLICLKQFKIV